MDVLRLFKKMGIWSKVTIPSEIFIDREISKNRVNYYAAN